MFNFLECSLGIIHIFKWNHDILLFKLFLDFIELSKAFYFLTEWKYNSLI